MVDLKTYYDSRAAKFGDDQQLEQVGHTELGKAISNSQLDQLVEELISLLKLTDRDALLDLACGNGVITRRLATVCNEVCGVDFSAEMIKVAKESNSGMNLRYINSDVFNLGASLIGKRPFSKVLMYGALQHVKPEELESLISTVMSICDERSIFVLGFVPNIEKKWAFYDTLFKKYRYLYYKVLGRDLMGTWWSKREIKKCFNSLAMKCDFVDIQEGRYGFPYRFHVVASRH